MDDVMPTGQSLARRIDASDYRSVGYPRELMVEWLPDPVRSVTQLRQPVRPPQAETAGSPESTKEDH
jgi:hypothetical protein